MHFTLVFVPVCLLITTTHWSPHVAHTHIRPENAISNICMVFHNKLYSENVSPKITPTTGSYWVIQWPQNTVLVYKFGVPISQFCLINTSIPKKLICKSRSKISAPPKRVPLFERDPFWMDFETISREYLNDKDSIFTNENFCTLPPILCVILETCAFG